MKIHALKNLITLANSSSINEAARKLYISQPSLSKSIQQMEDELGFALFKRSKAGIELTSQGQEVLQGAQQIIAIYESWLTLPETSPLKKVRAYTIPSFSDFLLPETLLAVKEKYPSLTFVYQAVGAPRDFVTPDINAPALVMTLCDEAMLAALTQIQGNPPLILMSGQYECLINRDNPLSGCSVAKLDDLRQQFLMLPTASTDLEDPSTFLGPFMTHIIQTQPNHVLNVGSLRNVINSVRKNQNVFAVSFYPPLARYPGAAEGELVHIPFDVPQSKGYLCLFYSRDAVKKYAELQYLIDLLVHKVHEFFDEHGIDPGIRKDPLY